MLNSEHFDGQNNVCRTKSGITANGMQLLRLFEMADLVVCPNCRTVLKDRWGRSPKPAADILPNGFIFVKTGHNVVTTYAANVTEGQVPLVFVESLEAFYGS